MSSDFRRGLFWAFGAALGIAGFAVPWKLANSLSPGPVNTLILLTSAAVLNSALLGTQLQRLSRFGRFDLMVASGLAVLTLAGNLASAAAISLISPVLLTVVQRAEVIVVALLAWPLIGERIERRFWVGAAIAGLGLWILTDSSGVGEARVTGIAWAAIAMLCFSGMAVLTRKYIHRIDTVTVNGLRLWLAVSFWFASHGVPQELLDVSLPQVGLAALAGLSGPFAGRLCLMNASRYLEARTSTLVTLAAPPLTLVLAFVVLADLPSQRELLGSAIMLAGIAIPILAWSGAGKARQPG